MEGADGTAKRSTPKQTRLWTVNRALAQQNAPKKTNQSCAQKE